jgi:hypothetical protein
LSTDGHATSDSVILIALKTSSQADRLIVEGTGGAYASAAIGRLGEVLSKLAVGRDLADSSNSVKGIAVHTAGTGSGGSGAGSTVVSTLSALSSNGTEASGA